MVSANSFSILNNCEIPGCHCSEVEMILDPEDEMNLKAKEMVERTIEEEVERKRREIKKWEVVRTKEGCKRGNSHLSADTLPTRLGLNHSFLPMRSVS